MCQGLNPALAASVLKGQLVWGVAHIRLRTVSNANMPDGFGAQALAGVFRHNSTMRACRGISREWAVPAASANLCPVRKVRVP